MNASAFGVKPKKNAVPLLFRESEAIIDGCGIIIMHFFEAKDFQRQFKASGKLHVS